MSGNGSYIKSMNGIVSFDSGGTSIEGDEINTGIINCTTLNASSDVNTITTYTNFIENNTSSSITVTGDTTFNNDIYVSNLYPLPGIGTEINFNGIMRAASTLYTDFIAPNANTEISFSGDAKFNADVYVNNIYPKTGSQITLKNNTSVSGSLTSTSFTTPTIEGTDTNSLTKQLKIGQNNDLTTSINIGRAAQTILGTVFPAIPPRTTFYAVGNDDITNKLYVDSVTAGTNILSLTNIFTGASNTFNNFIKTSQIDSVTPSNTYSFLTSHTSTINIGTSSSAITLGSASAPVRTDYVPLANADICNKLYTDTKVSGGVSGLLASTNIWTGASNTFNNAIRCAIAPSAVTDLCNKTYVDSVAGSLLLAATNLWTGASNTFENVVKFGPSAGFQISIFPSNIESKNGSDTVGIFNNITTGNIEIGKLMGTNGGNINFMNNFKMVLSSGVLQFRSFAPGDNVALFSNLTNGNITIGGGQTNGDIDIGTGTARTTSGAINIGNGAGAIANPIRIGGTGSVTTLNGKLNVGTTRTFGYTSYVFHNGATGNYSITNANINIDFYIVTIGSVDCSVELNANITGQRVFIRNAMGAGRLNNVISPTSNIYRATGGFTNIFAMTENKFCMLLCDGTSWYVMNSNL